MVGDELNFSIRPFTGVAGDYEALAALYNYAYPEAKRTATEFKIVDWMRDPDLTCKRWVAERDAAVKGVGGFEHWGDFYHPHKYLLHIVVNPDDQGQGIGGALYDHVIGELSGLRPQTARVWVVQDRVRSRRFAEGRGFVREKLRWNFSLLDVQSCDLGPYDAHMEALRKEGIEIKSIAELAPDPERDRKLYELYAEVLNSIEAVDAVLTPSYDEIVRKGKSDAKHLNYTFVATHAGRYVGAWVLDFAGGNALFGGPMGVQTAYRRRGVALGLVVRAIADAKARRHPTITAHTDEHNKAILTLAEHLGFTHLPAQLLYVKSFEGKNARD